MKIKYEVAMQHLQGMFKTLDREVIHSVLIMHEGRLDPTIETLLELSREKEASPDGLTLSTKRRKEEDPFESIFSNDREPEREEEYDSEEEEKLGIQRPKKELQMRRDEFPLPAQKKNVLDLDAFRAEEHVDDRMAQKIQEEEDRKFAMALQKAIIKQEKEAEEQEDEYSDSEEEGERAAKKKKKRDEDLKELKKSITQRIAGRSSWRYVTLGRRWKDVLKLFHAKERRF
eukprot:TRINITY_DN9618_c0_g2_i3.p1 TRINITY_DN9618_c0_g2~~TRINITY_DN9618_c0_g2_i3.p1  ORF type:complete len:230 (-),score=69.66 TRINITY_DN9618_c0_g2_i3:371-1060(-)